MIFAPEAMKRDLLACQKANIAVYEGARNNLPDGDRKTGAPILTFLILFVMQDWPAVRISSGYTYILYGISFNTSVNSPQQNFH
jgi:hypothetical protein